MKKRILVALITAMSLVILCVAPCFAGAEAEVTLTPITVTKVGGGCGGLEDGDSVIVSGGVTVTADAETWGLFSHTDTDGNVWYEIGDNYTVLYSDDQSSSDSDFGWFWSESGTTLTLNWSKTFQVMNGVYTASEGGSANASFWTLFPFRYGSDADMKSLETSFTVHEKDPLAAISPQDMFTVCLANTWQHTSVKWDSNGLKGQTTASELVAIGQIGNYTYKVVIPAGTKITSRYANLIPCFNVLAYDGGTLRYSPDSTFSNPVTVYKLVNGEYTQVAQFTTIKDWYPQ